MSTRPSWSSRIVTTSAIDSRQAARSSGVVGADKHHGPVAAIELQQADELVDRAGRPGAAEEHDVLIAAVDGPVDDAAGLLPQRGGTAAGRRRLGVRVAIGRLGEPAAPRSAAKYAPIGAIADHADLQAHGAWPGASRARSG